MGSFLQNSQHYAYDWYDSLSEWIELNAIGFACQSLISCLQKLIV